MRLINLQWQIVIFLCLLFGSFLAEKKTHLYPSLVFPSFSNAPYIVETADFSVAEVYGITEQNVAVELKKEIVFDNLYYKHINYVINTIVERSYQGSGIYKENLKRYLQQSNENHYQSQFSSMKFVIGTVSYNVNTGRLNPSLTDRKTFTINLCKE